MTPQTGLLVIIIVFVLLFPILAIANKQDTSKDPTPAEQLDRNDLAGANTIVLKTAFLNDTMTELFQLNSTIPLPATIAPWSQLPFNDFPSYSPSRLIKVNKMKLMFYNPGAAGNDDKISPKIVVLDPGHGGMDPGAVVSDEILEKDIVLEYALMARESLIQSGYIVYMTHETDASCSTTNNSNNREVACRAEFAAGVNGDIFISIHADANPVQSVRGTVTFYNARSDLDGRQNPYPEQSKALATGVHQYVQPVMESLDRGVKNENYYVNRMNSIPSILIELGVLTNPDDLELLLSPSRPAKFAEALTMGIDQYFSQYPMN